MKKLNCFVNYEVVNYKAYGREERAVYLIEMHNEEKVEYFLHECNVMKTLNEKPFTTEEIFMKLLPYYALYQAYDGKFTKFIEGNTLACEASKEDTIWSKSKMISDKLERLFGSNLIFFIVSYFDFDLCFGLPEEFENMFDCEMIEFLIERLETKFGKVEMD